MKFLLVGFFGETYMPYIQHYEKILIKEDIKYDICYFDRYNTCASEVIQDIYGEKYFFHHKTNTRLTSKIFPVFQYLHEVKKRIKEKQYDKLIIFTTMPAVILSPQLLIKYRGKYIFDYRDYTYEKYFLFRFYVSQVMRYSSFVTFSSRGYLKYYKKINNYIITHNIANDENCIEEVIDLQKKNKICIGYLGYIRYFEENKSIIKAFANDTKYSLNYIGSRFSDCDLESFCLNAHINNVYFQGTYQNIEKPELYKKIDIINSLSSPEVCDAIPNRIYDAALYKKPIIVAKGTFLAHIVKEYGLGIAVDPFQENLKECVESYLAQFSPYQFLKNCRIFLKAVKEDQDIFNKQVVRFCRK